MYQLKGNPENVNITNTIQNTRKTGNFTSVTLRLIVFFISLFKDFKGKNILRHRGKWKPEIKYKLALPR